MRAKLKSEGEDNEDIRKALIKEEYKRTLPQVKVVSQRFESYREARKSAGEDHSHEEAEIASDRRSRAEEGLPNEAAAAQLDKASGDEMSFDDDMI